MILSEPALPPAVAAPAEGDLVIRACRGDECARDELARRHLRGAFIFALQLVGNRDDAMDIAQDAMLRFFTTLHRFDPARPVRPWLLRIVRNRVYDLHRRQKIRRHDSLDRISEDGRKFEVADLEVDLERDAERAQLRSHLWRSLGELTARQREILVLRDYQDLTYAEIARALDIPMGTVMSRLHAARKHLRRILQKDLDAIG